ncbi:MAG TPA: immunoglobulin domain-containing protein, partial [Methylomirabilota bacterium]|nr:immunoglobulin domain-containing protein [Methylomirabilota bacterium]
GVGVSRGYNGSQVFNTAYAAADPTEPNHCDLNGGASYWYAYQPPADGTLILDTVGSSYDTFIAAYTFDPPYSSYADLIPVACDDNGAGTNGAARLEVAAPQWRQFLVVVDGVNGARGTVHLNYRLDTNRPPVPPTLMQAPTPSRVAVGQDVTLQPMVSGSPPLRFTWRKDDRPLPDATNRVLWLQSVAPEHSGTYLVSVFNHVGGPLEVPMSLRVLVPPQLQCQRLPDGSELLWFISTAGQNYRVERADTLDGSWRMEPALYPGDGSVITLTNGTSNTAQFFRLRVE